MNETEPLAFRCYVTFYDNLISMAHFFNSFNVRADTEGSAPVDSTGEDPCVWQPTMNLTVLIIIFALSILFSITLHIAISD